MLYITRKKGESIIINNNITLTIIDVQGGKIKLGWEFPEDVAILRAEIHAKVADMNKESTNNFKEFNSIS
ncbi:MAG: carbon storage regulator [Alphaproteobacteria bacterium]|nr:carbon storage regulator [Alphaproteobacteria bacterium]